MAAQWCIGLMTGTVMDGNVDIAMIKTDGETIEEFGPYTLASYPPQTNQLIAEAMEAAQSWNFASKEPEIFARAEKALSESQAQAISQFLSKNRISAQTIALIGFHGQTVLHRAPKDGQKGATRQLGDGQIIADMLNIPVIYDFRTQDIEAGGQGAPLAAIYHQALLRRAGLSDNPTDTAILNLGGVANISWWDGNNTLIAFDTGPANAPLNDWINSHNQGEMDRDGLIASRGQTDEDRLKKLLQNQYFTQSFPKSLDRNSFTKDMAKGLSLENGAATLTAFSAAAVAKGLEMLPKHPTQLVVCGGGRKNPQLLREIETRANTKTVQAEELGWRGDAVEAECFAFLAARCDRNLPISFPGTTGVPMAMSGGTKAFVS
ncbi:Anhydro-N-acetylmuramic acid kinase [Pseudovibrio axinellae]|uniref:Anhydro-N-acetylmuramic acid kinase n=1 Tax=Pseudovibrio axinellae TaxID=989403 RepID=A0A166AKE1_9HYPH|nr:anhydro-N-acetylmuramic acid kinase [Pseudovibrio axinellae]KZL21230.1 Anhydro-N-acetylmuramic acid kinase [Pseudovibrio axinellae]SEQ92805.1 anhydro-N-acetylmuramic acid kinase [Pseudovibrio axinellae]